MSPWDIAFNNQVWSAGVVDDFESLRGFIGSTVHMKFNDVSPS